jgi:amino acid transporter
MKPKQLFKISVLLALGFCLWLFVAPILMSLNANPETFVSLEDWLGFFSIMSGITLLFWGIGSALPNH